jgi:hypothetical protein
MPSEIDSLLQLTPLQHNCAAILEFNRQEVWSWNGL